MFTVEQGGINFADAAMIQIAHAGIQISQSGIRGTGATSNILLHGGCNPVSLDHLALNGNLKIFGDAVAIGHISPSKGVLNVEIIATSTITINGSIKTASGNVVMQALGDILMKGTADAADDPDGILTSGGTINLKSKTKVDALVSFPLNTISGSGNYTETENPAGSINIASVVTGSDITLTTDPLLTISLGPGTAEICNGIDDDCDGIIDEGVTEEYFGNLTFTSQAELDAFPTCYTIINGNVTVTGNDITSLSGLAHITEINGNLSIAGNQFLANLDGLENLTSIVGSFTLDNNAILTDLDGINHTMYISLNLIIINNPVLGTCAVESICFYLAHPIASRIGRVLGINISNNAVGCMDVDQVMAACSSLPVTLVAFDADKEENTVLLKWKTAEEENSANFDIQRSADGKNWNSIGVISAAGDANTEISYSFYDTAPLKGNNLYRLKMIDIDGTFTFSSMRSVYMDSQSDFAAIVYPNPSAEQIRIQLEDWTKVKKVQIVDLKGKVVYTENTRFSDPIQIKNLLSGIYILRIEMADEKILTRKIVKQ